MNISKYILKVYLFYDIFLFQVSITLDSSSLNEKAFNRIIRGKGLTQVQQRFGKGSAVVQQRFSIGLAQTRLRRDSSLFIYYFMDVALYVLCNNLSLLIRARLFFIRTSILSTKQLDTKQTKLRHDSISGVSFVCSMFLEGVLGVIWQYGQMRFSCNE